LKFRIDEAPDYLHRVGFGAKLVGELTNNSVPTAHANAVPDAVGVRIRTLPVTAERVFEALRSSAASGQV